MNLFAYFEIGRKSLQASQTALSVAGNNIANINTPGFSRRRINLSTTFPQRVPGGYVGQGVDVLSLHRVRDRFLSTQIQGGLSARSGLAERQRTLSGLEAMLGPIEGSPIVSSLRRLAEAFTDVSGAPENLGVRGAAVNAAASLASDIRSSYAQVKESRRATDAALVGTTTAINDLTEKIAALNVSIRQLEVGGSEASDFRDQRDLALGQLSELVDINVIRNGDGSVGVGLVGTGTTIVTSESSFRLVAEPDAANPGVSRIVVDIPGNRTDVTQTVKGGQLGGLLQARDDVLTGVLADLDRLAADLAATFNGASAAGFDLNGAAGGAIFTISIAPGVSAAEAIDVDAALRADPSLLAAGAAAAPGDGGNAAALADLIVTGSAGLGNVSPESFYRNLLTRIGTDLAGTDTRLEAESLFVEGLQAMSDSVSGVNLDEEAVALVQFQRSYEASARFIQILDRITQVAVNLGAN